MANDETLESEGIQDKPGWASGELDTKITLLDEKTLPKEMTIHHLVVEALLKHYGRKHILKGVSFSMASGEVVGFLGPNGAGKTTAFYSIMGFIKPDGGKVLLDGMDITHEPMYRRARAGISYLPQEASVFRRLSVADNIKVVLETRKDLSKGERKDRIQLLLEELGIQDLAKQQAYSLSGGERRRTEIARALALDPKFLLLDEPFAGIDPKAVYEIKMIIRKLADRNIGILITDHNVRDTLQITSHSCIISDGKVVVAGSKDEILGNELARTVYLGHSFDM